MSKLSTQRLKSEKSEHLWQKSNKWEIQKRICQKWQFRFNWRFTQVSIWQAPVKNVSTGQKNGILWTEYLQVIFFFSAHEHYTIAKLTGKLSRRGRAGDAIKPACLGWHCRPTRAHTHQSNQSKQSTCRWLQSILFLAPSNFNGFEISCERLFCIKFQQKRYLEG